jgi:hypothetical protein
MAHMGFRLLADGDKQSETFTAGDVFFIRPARAPWTGAGAPPYAPARCSDPERALACRTPRATTTIM